MKPYKKFGKFYKIVTLSIKITTNNKKALTDTKFNTSADIYLTHFEDFLRKQPQ